MKFDISTLQQNTKVYLVLNTDYAIILKLTYSLLIFAQIPIYTYRLKVTFFLSFLLFKVVMGGRT